MLAALLIPMSAGCGDGDQNDGDMAVSTVAPSDAELLLARPYTATLPAAYSVASSWPLLIVLAGFGDHGADTSSWLGLTQLAAADGVFLVTPDPDPAHLRLAWDPSPVHYPNFDVEYLTAIIHDLEKKYSIDRGRVFVAGHSLGAHMAHRMACDDSADVAAIMSLAGEVTKVPADCAPKNPVSVLQVHGTADKVIGYNGDVQDNPPDPTIPSAHETVAVWARNDACSGGIAATGVTLDLDSTLAGAETTIEAYAGCPTLFDRDAGTSGSVAVELWSIQGGSHKPTFTPEFAPLVWSFLTAHARP